MKMIYPDVFCTCLYYVCFTSAIDVQKALTKVLTLGPTSDGYARDSHDYGDISSWSTVLKERVETRIAMTLVLALFII
jgi:hypothetical protein